jgi:hypothetical protein
MGSMNYHIEVRFYNGITGIARSVDLMHCLLQQHYEIISSRLSTAVSRSWHTDILSHGLTMGEVGRTQLGSHRSLQRMSLDASDGGLVGTWRNLAEH